jgi:hypothetical protein
MPIKPAKYPRGHLPPYERRTPYRQTSPTVQLPDAFLAYVAQRAFNRGWTIHLVEDQSPIFVDSYGRQSNAPFIVFKGGVGPSECYEVDQVLNASGNVGECILYVRQHDNDHTTTKMSRWEQKLKRLIEGPPISTSSFA